MPLKSWPGRRGAKAKGAKGKGAKGGKAKGKAKAKAPTEDGEQ